MDFDRPITIAVIFFIILILMYFLVLPAYNNFKDLQIKLGEKKAEFNAKYAYYSEVAKVFYQLEERKDSVKVIDDALPDNPSFGRLMYFFQEKAKENGLIVKDLFLAKYALGSQTSTVKEIVFSFNITGTYVALKNFILSLEKSARLFEITSISFSSTQASLNTPATQLPQFQIGETYSFKMEVITHSY